MSKKKKSEQEMEPADEVQAETPEAEAASSEAEVSPEEYEALKQQLEEFRAQADEYKDGWQRAVADFSNYRKRVDQERSQTYANAIGDVIKAYLPIVDDLELAVQDKPEGSWANGVELIYRKLRTILETEGVQRIEAEGQVFDPNFHEAIAQEPSDKHASGEIIEIVQQGYMLGQRVIRPAKVKVAQ